MSVVELGDNRAYDEEQVVLEAIQRDVQEATRERRIERWGLRSNYNSFDFREGDFILGRRVVHSVHSVAEGGALLRQINRIHGDSSSNVGGCIVARHAEHTHVVHGCKGINKCRCFEKTSRLGIFGRPYEKYTEPPEHYSGKRLDQLWEHLVQGEERAIVFVQLDSTGGYGINGSDRIFSGDRVQTEKEVCLQRGSEERPTTSDNGDHQGGHSKKNEISETSGTYGTALSLFKKAKLEWTVDIERLTKLPMKRDRAGNYVFHMKRRDVLNVLDSLLDEYYGKVMNYTFERLKSKIPHDCNFGHREGHFMSRKDSFTVLKLWFKTNYDKGWKMEFTNWIDWFNFLGYARYKKRNTIILYGPPSCGKTLIAEPWKYLALFNGKILSYVKQARFLFGGCVRGRLFFHDECIQPLNDDSYLETLKCIYAGTTAPVDVKFQKDPVDTACAPVIGTANTHPVRNPTHMEAFMERCHFKQCVPMKEALADLVYGKIHPIALFDLHEYCLEKLYFIPADKFAQEYND